MQAYRGEYPSLWAAIESIAPKIGCVPQTLLDWVKQVEALEAIKAMHASLLAQRPEFRDYCPALPCPALLDHDRGFLRFAQDGEY